MDENEIKNVVYYFQKWIRISIWNIEEVQTLLK